jgi:uncharacterized membrane protein YdbT with pleckstrin-like domain
MTVHPSSRLTILGMVLLELAIIAGNIVYFFSYEELNLPLLIVPMLLVSLWNVPKLVTQRTTRLTVADSSVRYESGVLNKTTRTMDLKKVQDVRVDQTLAQRLLGLGDIAIQSAGEHGGHISLRGVERPHDVASEILAASGKRSARV